ncbi:hypothetical protein BH24BAC1_BH24BAC1_33230 [soil metagenome]
MKKGEVQDAPVKGKYISRKDHKGKRHKGRKEAFGKPLFAFFADAFVASREINNALWHSGSAPKVR